MFCWYHMYSSRQTSFLAHWNTDTHLGVMVFSCSWYSLVSLSQVPLPRNPNNSLFLQDKIKILNRVVYTHRQTTCFSTARATLANSIFLTFPPLVNLWICAVATPGMIIHTVMMAKLGRISYHMMTAAESNSDNNQDAPRTACNSLFC